MAVLSVRVARVDENPSVLRRHLTKLTIAWVIVAWGWLAIGLLLGGGKVNAFTTTPFGQDLLSLHAAGTTLLREAPGSLYDDAVGRRVQAETLGPVGRDVFNRYMSPPHTAWLFAPLAWLPFGVAVWLWSAASLLGLGLVPRLLRAERPWQASVAALGFAPVFDGFAVGQNALLTLALFAATWYFWRRDQGTLAGLALGLVAVYKPHLVVGPALLFLLDIRRDPRPFVALLLVLAVLAGIDLWFFPEESRAFVAWGGAVTAGSRPLWTDLRPGGELTVMGFLRLLLPGLPRAALALAFAVQAAAVLGFVVIHRQLRRRGRGRHGERVAPGIDRTLFVLATLLTLWLAPHAHLYEWTLLVLPGILLWIDRPRDHAQLAGLFVLVALGTAVSVRLARVQLELWAFALHPAVPLLLLVTVVAARGGRNPRHHPQAF